MTRKTTMPLKAYDIHSDNLEAFEAQSVIAFQDATGLVRTSRPPKWAPGFKCYDDDPEAWMICDEGDCGFDHTRYWTGSWPDPDDVNAHDEIKDWHREHLVCCDIPVVTTEPYNGVLQTVRWLADQRETLKGCEGVFTWSWIVFPRGYGLHYPPRTTMVMATPWPDEKAGAWLVGMASAFMKIAPRALREGEVDGWETRKGRRTLRSI